MRLSSDERRLEIVKAVLDLAGERGPDAITTQAIADHIGVTQGALFRHFPDKEAMWLAVFEWVRVALGAAFDAAVAEARSPIDKLERAFVAHVAFVAAHPGVAKALFHELQYPADSRVRVAVREMVGGYRARLSALLESAKAAGELPASLDATLAAVLFVGAVQGLVIDATLRRRGAQVARDAHRMFALLLGGWRGGPPARTLTRATTRTSRAARRATR
ncbi:MAG TPA: TetR/AcrR family transcriptional regulator [Casimicrobiaceae bacterium]|nr:TetR/AcrR family transcriptional regulator [Casimicrobiaceae bacterium]